MRFTIIGSNIHNLTNAYILSKLGHEITVVECKNSSSNRLKNDSILFDYYPNLIEHKKILNNKLRFHKIFHNKKTDEEITEIVNINNSILESFIKEEKIKFKNKQKGILYLFKDKNEFQKITTKVKYLPNYQSFTEILPDFNFNEEKGENNLSQSKNFSAILLNNKFTVDKDKFISDIKQICQEKYNVKFEEVTEINNILTNHQKITGINTDKGVFVSDKYIVNFNNKNLSLLSGIKIDLKLQTSYKINIFNKIDNINNYNFEHNILDKETGIFYVINGKNCKISINLTKNDYKNIISKSDMDYFAKIAKLNLLDIKDYKNIKYNFIKEEYINNGSPMICKSDKYDNLFLNGGYGSRYSSLSFGGSKILCDIILQNN